MKKNWLSIVIVIVVLFLGFAVYTAIQRSTTGERVSFKFADQNGYVRLLNKDGVETARFYNDITLDLEKGSYMLVAESEDYAVENYGVNVEGTMEVKISYVFSGKRLEELLTQELADEFDEKLSVAYPMQMRDHIVTKRRLFGEANWAGVIVESRAGREDNIQSVYRVVFRKNGAEWNMMGRPELILTMDSHPNVPLGILEQINRLGV